MSRLGIHDSVHVEEIALPDGVRIVAETNFAIVTVLPPTVEVVEAPAEAAPEAEAAPAEAAQAAPEQQAARVGEVGLRCDEGGHWSWQPRSRARA